MNPSNKSPEMNDALSRIFGVDRDKTIRENNCVSCGGPVEEFRSEISQREYAISGLCQSCQDQVFGP